MTQICDLDFIALTLFIELRSHYVDSCMASEMSLLYVALEAATHV